MVWSAHQLFQILKLVKNFSEKERLISTYDMKGSKTKEHFGDILGGLS